MTCRNDRPSKGPPTPVLWLILLAFTGFATTLFVMHLQSEQSDVHWSDLVGQALENGRLDQAHFLLLDAQRESGEDPQCLYMLAVVQGLRGEYVDAVSWLTRHPEFSRNPELTSMAAQFSLRAGSLTDGRGFIDQTLALDPHRVDTIRLLAHLESNLFRPNEVRRLIATLDQLGRATVEDVCLYCIADRGQYDIDRNIQHLEAMRSAAPFDCVIAYALASNYAAKNRPDEAFRVLQSTATSAAGPECWLIRLGQAELAIAVGDVAHAGDLLESLPAPSELLPRTWLARGRVLSWQRQLSQARTAFENASRLDPFDPEPLLALAPMSRSDGNSPPEEILSRIRRLQALHADAQKVLRGDAPQEHAGRLAAMARHLIDVNAVRAAEICLQDLKAAGQEPNALRRDLDRLIAEGQGRTNSLHVPSTADLKTDAARPEAASPRVSAGTETGGAVIRFEDVTSSTGLAFEYVCDESLHKTVLTSLGGGVGVFDFDCDGSQDLFFPQGGPSPVASERSLDGDRCYRAVERKFIDVSAQARLGEGGYGHGVAVADFNNDGFPDLMVTAYGLNTLYQNNGDGTFKDVTRTAGLTNDEWSTSAVFADFDTDGDLDLYYVNYLDVPIEEMVACTDSRTTPCGPHQHAAQQDRLYENLGDGGFRDRTEVAGVVVPDGKGLGVVTADFNGDGRADIFVANDTTTNRLFLNCGFPPEGDSTSWISFRETAIASGVAFSAEGVAQACMGIACQDIDGNGLADLFVTNFEGETNTLYLNAGAEMFIDRTGASGLGHTSYQLMGWGTQLLDADADGDLDLFLVNGHLHDLAMPAQMFVQREPGRFEDVSRESGPFFEANRLGRGVAVIDWNRDSLPDVVGTHRVGAAFLLANRTQAGDTLAITLIGHSSNRDAIGAELVVEFAEHTVHRILTGGGGYLCANQRTLFVGLGTSPAAQRIRVKWPGGRVDEWQDVSAGAVLLTESGRKFAK
jgi:enediyne biosynthesis protein E4